MRFGVHKRPRFCRGQKDRRHRLTVTVCRGVKFGGFMQDIVVFFFAHQDDEFAVFFAIEEAVREGAKVICLYLTDGGYGGQSTLRRNDESRNVLRRLGVNEVDIDFIGTRQGYRDGHLYMHLEDALRSVEAILDPTCNIRALYIPAWEGGHRDHDAVHLVGAAFAVKAGLVDIARQFPLYRAARNVIGFALFKPLLENGPIQAKTIPLPKRLRFLRLSFCYPSQWMYWAGLFPCLLYSLLHEGHPGDPGSVDRAGGRATAHRDTVIRTVWTRKSRGVSRSD
jgi:GlcNAc-PI de-N-acetylase